MAEPVRVKDMPEVTADALTGEEVYYAELPNGTYGKIKGSSLTRNLWPFGGSWHYTWAGSYNRLSGANREVSTRTPLTARRLFGAAGVAQKRLATSYLEVPAGKKLYLNQISYYLDSENFSMRIVPTATNVTGEIVASNPWSSGTNNYGQITWLEGYVLFDNSGRTTPVALWLLYDLYKNVATDEYLYSYSYSGFMEVR